MSTQTKLGITVLIFLASLIGVSYYLQNKTDRLLGVELIKVFNFQFESDERRGLKRVIGEGLKEKEGDFAVWVESLVTESTRYAINENVVMPSASLYKLVVMAAVYQEIEAGGLKKETVISSKKADLINIFQGVDYGYEEAGEVISYTVEEALDRVARVSDNFAAIMLSERVRSVGAVHKPPDSRSDPLQVMASELGMEDTHFGTEPVTTTASDIAKFFRRLYKGEVVSKIASEEIIELLAKSQLNSRIPYYLPKELKVAHKTGELPGVRHDAGIVFLPGQPYIIVIMGQNLKGEDGGIETEARLSEKVYEYLKGDR